MATSSFSGFLTVLFKEVTDNLRDRRTLTTLGVSLLITPIMLFGFLWFAEKTIKEETDLVDSKAIELPVVNAEAAPNLMAHLAQQNISVIDAPENPEAAIKDGKYRVILEITDDYADNFTQAKSAPVVLFHDSSLSGVASVSYHQVKGALQNYGGLIGQMRLQARGINPQITNAVMVNVIDVANPEAKNAEILSMLPYLIIFFIMIGGTYLAIDTTAGEREKGSLEPLLCQPLDRKYILLGKLAATFIFSAATLLLMLIGLAVSFAYLPIDILTITITPYKIAYIFIACLPFVCVSSAMLILLASFTKSYKEAQSYLGMVMMVPTLPLILIGLLSPQPELSNMWVPSLSQGLIIIETLKGEFIDNSLVALSIITSLLVAAVLTFIAVKFYQRENVLG